MTPPDWYVAGAVWCGVLCLIVLFITPESFPWSPWQRLAAIVAAAVLWPLTLIAAVAWLLWTVLNERGTNADR